MTITPEDPPIDWALVAEHVPEVVGHCDSEIYLGCECGWRRFGDGELDWLGHMKAAAIVTPRG